MTRDFLVDTAERVIRTFFQSLAALWGANALNVLAVDWGEALSVAGGAALLSFVSCMAAIKLGGNGTASATDAVVTTAYADAVAHGRHAAGLTDGPRD